MAPQGVPSSSSSSADPAAQSNKPQQLDVERITRAWRAFMAYRGLSLQVFDTQALSFQHLTETHQALVPTVPIRLSHAAEAAEHNADLLERVAALTGVHTPFMPEHTDPHDLDNTVYDFPDVVDTLLAIVRDWSVHGEKERARMYDPVISAVQEAAEDVISTATASATLSTVNSRLSLVDLDAAQHEGDDEANKKNNSKTERNAEKGKKNNNNDAGLASRNSSSTGNIPNVKTLDVPLRGPTPSMDSTQMSQFIEAENNLSLSVAADVVANFCVLVVGASLGRLAWELARLGFSVQGVENSYLQLFTANFILNGAATPIDPLHLYPFVHHTGMVSTADDQLREVYFPDVDPRQLDHADFSMVAGDFASLYKDDAVWDCVVTCFSMENSNNVLGFVNRIAAVLKPGGVWVNHGSLDFRYEDADEEQSVEITQEELDCVIARCGLRVLRRKSFDCKPPYHVPGMVNEKYESIFFVAVKV